MTIDYHRGMAREGVFRAQRGCFKANTLRDDFIPHLRPCFTLIGLPDWPTSGSAGGSKIKDRSLTLIPYYPSVGFAYLVTPRDSYSA